MSTLKPKLDENGAWQSLRFTRPQFESRISRNWAQLAHGIGSAAAGLAKDVPGVIDDFSELSQAAGRAARNKIREIIEKRRLSRLSVGALAVGADYIPIMPPPMSGATEVFGSGTSDTSAPIVMAVLAIDTAP